MPLNQSASSNFVMEIINRVMGSVLQNLLFFHVMVTKSQNQTANQIWHSYKNDEFDWPF